MRPAVEIGGESSTIVRMSDDADPRPGLQDLPRLLRRIVDRGLELVSVRLELIQAEIHEEAQKRLRRLPYIVVPSIFLILGFMLLNVGLVALLAEAIGVTRAAFALAGLYLLIGGVGTWWFIRTGGLNPPDPEDVAESTGSTPGPAASPSSGPREAR
jgi:uncharacterized membrane protein YqjE